MINRGLNRNDEWITPRAVLDALGPFNLDVCCPAVMPWASATKAYALPAPKHLYTTPGNGLVEPWEGLVWCNPPYSNIMPWILRAYQHGSAILLLPAKSLDTKWGQSALATCTSILFKAGRVVFAYPDGSPSPGGWGPSMFVAYGEEAHRRLQNSGIPGYLMVRSEPESRISRETKEERR